MNSREWRKYCIANGLCVSCHKPSDTGKQYCSECAEKNRKRNAEMRMSYIEIGICPVCRVNDLVGDEKTCAECRALKAERDKNRDSSTWSLYKAEQRRRRFANSLCLTCGKPLDNNERHSTCSRCREKRRQDYAVGKGQDRSNRTSKGRCYICGSYDLVDGKNLCVLCYDRILKNTRKMNDARRKHGGKKEGVSSGE